jgi:hypothetical protein
MPRFGWRAHVLTRRWHDRDHGRRDEGAPVAYFAPAVLRLQGAQTPMALRRVVNPKQPPDMEVFIGAVGVIMGSRISSSHVSAERWVCLVHSTPSFRASSNARSEIRFRLSAAADPEYFGASADPLRMHRRAWRAVPPPRWTAPALTSRPGERSFGRSRSDGRTRWGYDVLDGDTDWDPGRMRTLEKSTHVQRCEPASPCFRAGAFSPSRSISRTGSQEGYV